MAPKGSCAIRHCPYFTCS